MDKHLRIERDIATEGLDKAMSKQKQLHLKISELTRNIVGYQTAIELEKEVREGRNNWERIEAGLRDMRALRDYDLEEMEQLQREIEHLKNLIESIGRDDDPK